VAAALSLSVAPMMERTDRHFRYLMRLASPNARLYTEMITAAALQHGDAGKLLAFDPSEHPVTAQLGGSDPEMLAAAAAKVAAAGYDEVNLNVGCPSSRVQAGEFGARLMLEPGRVGECIRAMREAVSIPVTVKTRIGVDDQDDYEVLRTLTVSVIDAGVGKLIVHARKAWLNGLSPKQNREIPPLDYPRVYRLKQEFPALRIIINGGFTTETQVLAQAGSVDGVMLGRAAYADPLFVGRLDARLYGGSAPGIDSLLAAYAAYMQREHAGGTPLRAMTRHLMGLFRHRPGARRWRQRLASAGNDAADVGCLLDELATFGAGSVMSTGTRYNDRSTAT